MEVRYVFLNESEWLEYGAEWWNDDAESGWMEVIHTSLSRLADSVDSYGCICWSSYFCFLLTWPDFPLAISPSVDAGMQGAFGLLRSNNGHTSVTLYMRENDRRPYTPP